MLTQVGNDVFRWETPDPTGRSARWGILVGHLFVRESGCVFVDPPIVPGLTEAAGKLAKPLAVLLTTQNNFRGARFLKEKLNIPVYLPEQSPDAVEPQERVSVQELGDFRSYADGRVLDFEVHRFMNDYALLTDRKELINGDNAVGDELGNVLVQPGFLPLNPPYPPEDAQYKEFRDKSREAFRELVRTTQAVSLYASHGFDIVDVLQEKAESP